MNSLPPNHKPFNATTHTWGAAKKARKFQSFRSDVATGPLAVDGAHCGIRPGAVSSCVHLEPYRMAAEAEEADADAMAVDENDGCAGDDATAYEVVVCSEASAQAGTYWD